MLKEVRDSVLNKYEGIQYGPLEESNGQWRAIYKGPELSAYEGTDIVVDIDLPKDYPFSPPVMKSDLYHPNVYPDSKKICMSILHEGLDRTNYEKPEERWNAAKSIAQCVLSWQQILIEPNLESPANPLAGRMYEKKIIDFKQRVLDNFIKKQQEQSFKECLQADQLKDQKRKLAENALDGPEKKMKLDGVLVFKSILPQEPLEGEDHIVIKFRTKKQILERKFSPRNKIICLFDFLSSESVNAASLKGAKSEINPTGEILRESGSLALNERILEKRILVVAIEAEDDDN